MQLYVVVSIYWYHELYIRPHWPEQRGGQALNIQGGSSPNNPKVEVACTPKPSKAAAALASITTLATPLEPDRSRLNSLGPPIAKDICVNNNYSKTTTMSATHLDCISICHILSNIHLTHSQMQ